MTDTGSLSTPTAAASPAVSLDKIATTAAYAAVGDNISWGFIVTNAGDVTLNNIIVTDPLVPAFSCTIATLAPAASNTACATTYQVTQSDINNGQVNNTASANATAARGLNPTATDSAIVAGPVRTASATIFKSATPATYGAVGDVISYSYLVTNTGNISLTGALTVSDDKVTTVNCPALPVAGLPPGGTRICTASYSILQADLDAGLVTNTAAASANSAIGSMTSPTSSATVNAVPAPTVTIVKTAAAIVDSDGNGEDAGDTITYNFGVKNEGNVTLSSLAVSDPMLAAAVPPSSVACPVTSLAPGSSTTCTATYVLTQSDIDLGSITNTATATASPPSGPPVSDLSGTASSNDTPTTSTITPSPAIAVVKTAGGLNDLNGNGADPGDTIGYTFTVSNTGNVTLASVGVTDAKIGTVSCPSSTLSPGASTLCTGTYTLTLADVNAGQITNTAIASGTPPNGAAVSDTSGSTTSDDTPTVTPVNQVPAISLVKAAGPIVDLDGNGPDVGDQIAYDFTVSNQGNVSLDTIAIADAKVAPVLCPATSLAPGANMLCQAAYLLTQADVDAGNLTNTATASGRAPGGSSVSDVSGATTTDDAPTISAVPQAPALVVYKTSPTPSYTAVGDVVDYSYLVQNTGNVTITNTVAIIDDKTPVTCPALPGGGLAPGGSLNCAASHVVTQSDIDTGSVTNTASAATTYGPGNSLISSPDDQVTVPAVQTPAMVVAKSATAINFINVGDTITYQYIITNTGNTTLTGPFTVSDNRVPTVNCPTAIIAPGSTLTCNASYAVVIEDLDLGSVTNLASASNGLVQGNYIGTTTGFHNHSARCANSTCRFEVVDNP